MLYCKTSFHIFGPSQNSFRTLGRGAVTARVLWVPLQLPPFSPVPSPLLGSASPSRRAQDAIPHVGSVGSWPATIATKVAKPAPPLVVNSSTGCGLRAKIECPDPVHSKNDQTVWLSWFQDRALYSSIFLRILRVNSQASPERKCVRNHGICTNRVVGNLAIKVQNFWESL